MNKITPENKITIINRILKGDSYNSISKDYKVVASTIVQIGHDMGMGNRQNGNFKRKWTPETIDQYLITNHSSIKRMSPYLRHCKTKGMWKCSLCGYEWETTFDSIKRKIKIGCGKCGTNKYSVFHDFLDTVNEHSAYIIGVYFATGHIEYNNVYLRGTPNKLKNIAKLISCTYPIVKHYKKVKSHYLIFKSPKISNKLKSLNRNVIPTEITPKLLPHFIRGYVDFKGHIEEFYSKYNNKIYPQIRITITGNLNILRCIQKHYQQLNFKGIKRKGYIREKQHELYIAGNESVYSFLNWIYNSEVNLLRYISNNMYNTYLNSKIKHDEKKQREEFIKISMIKYRELSQKLKNYTYESLAKKYSLTPDSIYHRIATKKSNKSINKDMTTKKILLSNIKRLKSIVKNKTGVDLTKQIYEENYEKN